MSQSILFPGTDPSYSAEFTVTPSTCVVVAVYTADGIDVGPGPALILEVKGIDGKFYEVETEGRGLIVFGKNLQQLYLKTEGTYRVRRPDLLAWDDKVGVEISYHGAITPTPSPVICNTIPFDYTIVNVIWTYANGEDLDPRMVITNPPRNVYVGWNRQSSDENFIKWAGDEQGNEGTESFLLDMRALKTAYPDNNDVTLDLTGLWYTRYRDGNIKVTLDTYSGGTIEQDGHTWVNNGGTQVSTETFWTNTRVDIEDANAGRVDRWGVRMAEFKFDYCTGKFITDVLRPAVTPTPTVTPTMTQTPSRSAAQTPTMTASVTVTPTITPTLSRTSTPTRTPSRTPSVTPTITLTPSITPTISLTPSITPSLSRSATATVTPSPTLSLTPSITVTPTITPTISYTASPTVTPSPTPKPTLSVSVTASVTVSSSVTPTPSRTPTHTPTPSPTESPVYTVTPSVTPTITPTISTSATVTPTVTGSQTPTPTNSPTPETTKSQTPTVTPTQTPTQTSTPTPETTKSMTPTVTPSQTASQTATPAPSAVYEQLNYNPASLDGEAT
jgi:hypothetical protein